MSAVDVLPPPPTSGRPELPAEYGQLTERLEAVGHRFRLAFVLRGVARFLIVVAPVTALVLFVAGYFTLPGWMRMGIAIGWIGVVAWGYVRHVHGPVFHRPSFAEIARLIEERAGGKMGDGKRLDNALINAVLLAQELDGERPHPWIPALVREAAEQTAEMPLEQSVPWREPRNAWLWALLAMATIAGWVAMTPGTFAHGAAVLATPARFVPRQGAVRIVNVVPGDDTALAGQPLLFAVSVDSPEHKTVTATLQVRYLASGKTANYPMMPFGTDNSQYNRQGIVAAEDMDYLVVAGDTQSRQYHITVLPQIHLTELTLTVTPPAYTGKAKQEVKLTGKDAMGGKASVEGPVGSKVELGMALDGPAKEVLMDVAGGSPMALVREVNNRAFSTSMVLRQSIRYTLRINDGANRTLQQFPDAGTGAESFYAMTAVPDVPPTIAVSLPGRDVDAKPGDKLALEAQATDDYGLSQVRLEVSQNEEKEFRIAQAWTMERGKDGGAIKAATVRHTLDLPASKFKFGDTLRYRFVAVDNRDLASVEQGMGPQTTAGQTFAVTFNDTAAEAAKTSKLWEELRMKLAALLDKQVGLRKAADGLAAGMTVEAMRRVADPVEEGQKGMRADIAALAKDFPFEPSMKLVQKSLQVLAVEDATGAVDRGADILVLSDARTLAPLATRLRLHQSRIIDVLQTLLAVIAADQNKLARTADHEGGDLPNDMKEAWKKLAEDLKGFQKEQKGVMDATADLAKKPKDQFDANDNQKLKDLAAIEDKWEKFLNNRLADMSKIGEQDLANASLLEEMVQMKVELTTAKDALNAKATEIATPLEENGLESAQALTTHIERWLQQQPDRLNWQMEEPVTQNDQAMAELPKQLQDMVGDLMDKEEDLTEEMESMGSKWNDSLDKGAGWDAMDGPISNMSAQGVTGNQLPKDMEIQGRSGEGREGRSSGEMVGAVAEGKEGRRTPTRLTNDAFSNSQVEDKSKLPAGGATGGGKKAGLGSEGLEGPAPADDHQITQRLAGQQAQIRNEAERLSLQMHAAKFDNFKLMESAAYLKKSEDALKQYQYHTALYYQQEAVQSLNTAKVIAAGQLHVIADTSPKVSEKTQRDIDTALNGAMPKGYADPVKAYFEKMANEGSGAPQ